MPFSPTPDEMMAVMERAEEPIENDRETTYREFLQATPVGKTSWADSPQVILSMFARHRDNGDFVYDNRMGMSTEIARLYADVILRACDIAEASVNGDSNSVG